MSVLFVTACSLTKATGGTATFDEGATIPAATPRHAEQLTARRDEVRELVKNGETADWQGVPLKDLSYNRDLVRGTEFGGRKGALYMPAVDRYEGRFFQALGDAGKSRCRMNDRLLIVSGLYGLLRTSEPMQLYSCPLSAEVAAIWRRDGLLTDIVRAYVKCNDVLRVFDLTAMEAYRGLVDWDRIAADSADVVHAFDGMAAGESALTSFGGFLGYLLSLSDDELIGPDTEHPHPEFRTCRLQRSTEPPPGYPTETWPVDMAREVLGGGNAARVLRREAGYLDADFRPSTARILGAAERGYYWLFEWTGLAAGLRRLGGAVDLGEYVRAALVTVQVLMVRVVPLVFSAPAFLLFGVVGLAGGLTLRDIRRWSAGREFGGVYHAAKRGAPRVLAGAAFVYLGVPFAVHPSAVIVSRAALFGAAVLVVAVSFKKYR